VFNVTKIKKTSKSKIRSKIKTVSKQKKKPDCQLFKIPKKELGNPEWQRKGRILIWENQDRYYIVKSLKNDLVVKPYNLRGEYTLASFEYKQYNK
jgi:hypothetical protein